MRSLETESLDVGDVGGLDDSLHQDSIAVSVQNSAHERVQSPKPTRQKALEPLHSEA